MSLITFFCNYNNYNNLNILIYFIVLHTLTSTLLFLLNDSIYIRFKTRKTKINLGLANSTPKLNFILLVIWLLFTSIPFSFKFIFEILVLLKCLSFTNILFITILLCLQLLTLVFVTANIISYSFGNTNKISYDLTKTELIIYLILIALSLALVI